MFERDLTSVVFLHLFYLPFQHVYDQKNIRRRVYDALNVLMAMNIISKEKKEIKWIGLPTNSAQECQNLEVKTHREEFSHFLQSRSALLLHVISLYNFPFMSLQVERQRRLERIKQKQSQLQELILQVRNKLNAFAFPFKWMVTRNIRNHISSSGQLMCAALKVTTAIVIMSRNHRNHDWPIRAACVFICTSLMSVKIAHCEGNIEQVKLCHLPSFSRQLGDFVGCIMNAQQSLMKFIANIVLWWHYNNLQKKSVHNYKHQIHLKCS